MNGDQPPVNALESANALLPQGEHPSEGFSYALRITEPRYYAAMVYYLTSNGLPPSHELTTGENYNQLVVEYKGPLEAPGSLTDWTV